MLLDKIKSSKTKLNEYKKILKILYQIQKLKILKLKIFLKKNLIYQTIQKLKYLKSHTFFWIGTYQQIN